MRSLSDVEKELASFMPFAQSQQRRELSPMQLERLKGEAYKEGLFVSGKIPEPKKHPIDPLKLQKWVGCHRSEHQKTAQALASSVQHISFDAFQKGLEASLSHFYKEKLSAKEQNKKYWLVLMDYPDGAAGHSGSWVPSLVLQKILNDSPNPPDHICSMQTGTLQELLKEEALPDFLLVMDDASFSGTQIKAYLKRLEKELKRAEGEAQSLEINLVIPYTSTKARLLILEEEHLLLHTDQCVKSIEELLSKEALEDFKKSAHCICPDGLFLTYFDHKMPDTFSVSDIVSCGYAFTYRQEMTNCKERAIQEKGWKERLEPLLASYQACQEKKVLDETNAILESWCDRFVVPFIEGGEIVLPYSKQKWQAPSPSRY